MKRGNYYNRENVDKGSRKLPKGAYICKIISAKEDQNEYGNRLVIAFDISEGEYAGFYQEKFNATQSEDKKWSGVVRINIPIEDGSENDSWRIKAFNTALVAVEDSNPGYSWNWDEKSLKGKAIGVIFNEKQFRGRDGSVITFTQPKRLTSVQSVKDGTYYPAKDEPLNEERETTAANDWMAVGDLDDEIPFA